MEKEAFLELLFKRWARSTLLSKEDKEAVAGLPWSLQVFARESYLAREGEPTRTCGVLARGLAFRQKLTASGARQIISIHIPGEFLDLQNCLLDVADHNVQTLGQATVAIVPKEELVRLIAALPNVRRAIWHDTLIDASVFREWVVNVGRRDARTRIAHLLCELAARLRASGECDENVCDFPLTQEHIADCTGLTPVHTNRTLQSLRKDELISLSSNRLTILDADALEEVGDFNERYLHHTV